MNQIVMAGLILLDCMGWNAPHKDHVCSLGRHPASCERAAELAVLALAEAEGWPPSPLTLTEVREDTEYQAVLGPRRLRLVVGWGKVCAVVKMVSLSD